MSSPYEQVRRVVSGGRSRPAFTPNLPAVAVYNAAAGGLVATYPATAYPRYLDRLATTASVVGPVAIYAGSVTPPARLTNYGDGSAADYSPPNGTFVPGGTPVLVVWTTTNPAATASCNAQFRQAV